MSRGVSGRAWRRASLALLSLACLARLPSARGAVHAYGHDAFERVGDAFFFYAGREGMLRGRTTRATTGETLRGVNDGRSYVQLNEVVFVRAEEAASRHADAGSTRVTGAVEAVFFEARDAPLVGYSDADGNRKMCCDAAAVASLGCVEGRVVVVVNDDADDKNDKKSDKVWTAEALFFGAEREARFASPTRCDVSADGMYELLFVSCDAPFDGTNTGEYVVAGRSAWKNPDGYLPGRKRHDRVTYGFAAASYAVLLFAWTYGVASKISVRDAVQLIHVVIFAVLILGMAEYLARYANAVQFNETGTKPIAGVVFASLVSSARESASRACALFLSLGLGVTRLALGDDAFRLTKSLTGMYFVCSLVLELDTQRVLVRSDAGAWRVGVGADAHDDVETSARELLALPVALLDATFAVLTFSALSKTLAKLKARRQNSKLLLYRQFTDAIAIFFVVSVFWQAFATFLAVADGVERFAVFADVAPYWEWEWTARAGWIAIEIGVTACVCVLWRPSFDTHRYAYRELEHAFSEGGSEEARDGECDEKKKGAETRRDAARGARKPKTDFHGLMAGTPGRGVALEQTPIRRGGFDDSSSDEEAKME